jgi:nucleoside transporter
MMLLQYAVWGAWLPIASRFLTAMKGDGGLGFSEGQMATILGIAGAVGAITAPFIAGQIADRYFSTERCLAVLLGTGGIISWILAEQTSYNAWLWLSIAYSVTYMPTVALTNSLAFAHLTDRSRQFPYVRVWGTLGWIAASWIFPMIWLQTNLGFQWMPPFIVGNEVPDVTSKLALAFKFSGGMSIAYAIYALALPHTPPRRDSTEKLAVLKGIRTLCRPSLMILIVAGLLIGAIHHTYFMLTSVYLKSLGVQDSSILPAMSVGQFSEIAMMPLLGFLLKRLGFRWVITIGAAAYFARFAIFAEVDLPVSVLIASQALHGVCFACFFAAAFIYVDTVVPMDVRHSAQTLFGITILGAGPILASRLVAELSVRFKVDGDLQFDKVWWTVAAIGGITAVLFAALFRAEPAAESENATSGT